MQQTVRPELRLVVMSATLTVDEAPAITSPDAVTFTVGTGGNFTIISTGYPTPTLARGPTAVMR